MRLEAAPAAEKHSACRPHYVVRHSLWHRSYGVPMPPKKQRTRSSRGSSFSHCGGAFNPSIPNHSQPFPNTRERKGQERIVPSVPSIPNVFSLGERMKWERMKFVVQYSLTPTQSLNRFRPRERMKWTLPALASSSAESPVLTLGSSLFS